MINENNDDKRRVWGALLLVSGCCIGAGMLGLPLMTITAGFWPSLCAFIISWLFLSATGLLLLEANLAFGQGIHLMTLAEKTFGMAAKIAVAVLFAFLFYCLMVAYIAGGGVLIQDLLGHHFNIVIDPQIGSLALVLFFGSIVLLGSSQVDRVNRLLIIGLGFSYGFLVILGLPHLDPNKLNTGKWLPVLLAFPAMIISFGYHNLVPTLTDYLKGNVRHLRIAILVGSGIPLLVYIIWNAVILGLLPADTAIHEAIDAGAMVTSLLQHNVGASYVVELLQIFSFLALVTSFMAVALSFVDFLADGIKLDNKGWGALFLVTLVLLPSLLFSYIYPTIFLVALNYAGAFGTVLLFGLFPIAMAWKGRYITKQFTNPQLCGGKLSLIILGAFAAFIFLMQLKFELGV